METRADWRILAVPVAFSVLLIGGAFWFAQAAPSPEPLTTTLETTADASGDTAWRETLGVLETERVTPEGEYRAPEELPPGDAMAQELLFTYVSLKRDGTLTPAKLQSAVEEIVARHAPTLDTRTYTADALLIDQGTDIIPYTGALTEALARSTAIKEYELKTFARSIGEKNTAGSLPLANAAALYRGIEGDLSTMRVPKSVVTEHLAVLNATAMLAYTTGLMAEWNGDPVFALAYIDQFVETERDVQLSISALYRKLGQIAQQS